MLRSSECQIPPEAVPFDVDISDLGDEADGVASHPQSRRSFHVPGALPGERVRATLVENARGRLDGLIRRSPERTDPICTLAGDCGGCVLQHRSQPANLVWKSLRVQRALNEAGFDAPAMLPPIAVGLGTRRRMELAVQRSPDGRVAIGLHRRGSHDIVDMVECHILDHALFALLAPLRTCLRSLVCLARNGSISLNLLDTGPDLLLRTDRPPDAGDRVRVAEFATRQRVSRVSWQDRRAARRSVPEALAQLAPARVRFSGHDVDVPPGAFLQAVRAAEIAIVETVRNALPTKPQIVELYAGCGTLTLPLSEHGRVTAYEGDPAAADALRRACGGRPIEVHARDLARRPVDASELSGANAVILDPPYDGAGRQIEQVARASPGTVVIVSCNPAALRREAGVLHQAGYELQHALAIDQFLFSPHVESVSVFRRGSSRRSRSDPSR